MIWHPFISLSFQLPFLCFSSRLVRLLSENLLSVSTSHLSRPPLLPTTFPVIATWSSHPPPPPPCFPPPPPSLPRLLPLTEGLTLSVICQTPSVDMVSFCTQMKRERTKRKKGKWSGDFDLYRSRGRGRKSRSRSRRRSGSRPRGKAKEKKETEKKKEKKVSVSRSPSPPTLQREGSAANHSDRDKSPAKRDSRCWSSPSPLTSCSCCCVRLC